MPYLSIKNLGISGINNKLATETHKAQDDIIECSLEQFFISKFIKLSAYLVYSKHKLKFE